MPLTKILALTSIALLSLTACTRSNAGTIATHPDTHLTPAQHQQLTATDRPIVLPTDIPADFRITDVITNVCPTDVTKPGCREGSSYTIVYRNPKNTCLLINAIGGGVGGGAADLEFRVRSSLLGDVSILIGNQSGNNRLPNEDDMHTYFPVMSSFPATIAATKTPYYNVAVAQTDGYYEQFKCDVNSSITPITFAKIVQSLTIVN